MIRGPVSRDGNIHVARLDSGPETKLSLTTNSLVSPADLELASENAEEPLSGLASPKTIDPVDPNAIDINLESSKQQYQQVTERKSDANQNCLYLSGRTQNSHKSVD